ncbi:M15 family metallopeptidase [Paenibacillus sp. y28]|uniref:M15 family metallopeptidase n=1 Tax=Paenibacillus sp. y28 TaxID=3129110 RepID=UPI003018D2EB
MKNVILSAVLMLAIATSISACGSKTEPVGSHTVSENRQAGTEGTTAGAPTSGNKETTETASSTPAANAQPGKDSAKNDAGKNTADGSTSGGTKNGAQPAKTSSSAKLSTITDAGSIAAVVNKQLMLPEDYVPADLVYPNVKFTFEEKIEKRQMRKEAAAALEKMFAAASKDGVPLAGVSAYRSHKRQKELFESYVRKDGEEKARTYSAYPGTSEHETGLAIDVSGADGRCAATECFAGTKEAKWLADHAHEYGFIIRYPKGKEDITGYTYEPWHLRYVGFEAAADIHKRGITLEEYKHVVEVSGSKQ